MKTKYLISIILILVMFSCNAQNVNEIKIVKDTDGISVGVLKNGEKEGNWIYYDSNSKVRKICSYKSNILEGKLLKFNTNGDMILSINFVNGRVNGDVLFYSTNNQLLAIYEYNNDIIKEIKFYAFDDESPPRNHTFLPDYK